MKVQDIEIFYHTRNDGTIHLCQTKPRDFTGITKKVNDIFKEPMKILFYTTDTPELQSCVTNIVYPIFRSEFKKVLENCVIIKGIIDPIEWAIRSHGGNYSIKAV